MAAGVGPRTAAGHFPANEAGTSRMGRRSKSSGRRSTAARSSSKRATAASTSGLPRARGASTPGGGWAGRAGRGDGHPAHGAHRRGGVRAGRLPACIGSVRRLLKPGGDALIKMFQGAGFQELLRSARGSFAQVRLSKPRFPRSRSAEMYLLAKDFLMV